MSTSTVEDTAPEDHSSNHAQADDTTAHRSARFRCKEKSKSRSDRHHHRHHGEQHSASSSHHHHRSKRRRHRRRTTPPPHIVNHNYPSAYDTSNLPPDQAFRESLFDALGDDEGAAFWEGVYGQAIHLYSDVKGGSKVDGGGLERMSEEEYVSYVRGKMWQRSVEGVEAARREKRRREEGDRRRRGDGGSVRNDTNSAAAGAAAEPVNFEKDIEASLRRGEERKRRKRWKVLWEEYLLGWEALQSLGSNAGREKSDNNIFLRNKIVWPVESGKRVGVNNPAEIEKFFIDATAAVQQDGERAVTGLMSALKVERVRWHPDKIQQRFGHLGIDEGTMKGVTTVFQVVDRMWNERKKSSDG